MCNDCPSLYQSYGGNRYAHSPSHGDPAEGHWDGEDAAVNVWHFTVPDTGAGTVAALKTALGAFYGAFVSHLSVALDLSKFRLKMYNMSDPEPREPFEDGLFTVIGPTGTAGGAPELAICLSFQGDPASGIPMRRRRGRVYLGPLAINVGGTSEDVPASMVATAAAAGQSLLNSSNASAAYEWIVLSQAGGGLSAVKVTNGWVDNAWDIQRRRGIPATVRTTFS